jgi:hypothetical protein
MMYNMNLNYVKWLKNTDVKVLPIFEFPNLKLCYVSYNFYVYVVDHLKCVHVIPDEDKKLRSKHVV